MIFCNLKGGLANMLFQIAATKSISLDKGVDCSFPNLEHQLNYLNLDLNCNPKLKHALEYNVMFNNLNTIKSTKNIPVINFPFEYVSVDIPNEDVFIDGFFQSEKYFKHNRDYILELFKIPDIIQEKINKKYSEFLKQKTTSIHVRRGDYVRQPNYHPVISIEYFNEGVSLLKNETDLFIIFSDDIDWCKKNIKLENVVYIENEKDYIELYVMSLCNNNIISNSSFSWWGAWLNENPRKKVIGPLKWFGNAIQHNTGDVLPENWIKI